MKLANQFAASKLHVWVDIEEYTKGTEHFIFQERKANLVCTMKDSCLPNQSIYCLNLGTDYRIKVIVQSKWDDDLKFKKISWIKLRPEGDSSFLLGIFQKARQENRTLEVLADFRAAEHKCPKLSTVSPDCGPKENKYVELDVIIGVEVDPVTKTCMELKSTIHLKMHPKGSLLIFPRGRRAISETWNSSPIWVKNTISGFFAFYKFSEPFIPFPSIPIP